MVRGSSAVLAVWVLLGGCYYFKQYADPGDAPGLDAGLDAVADVASEARDASLDGDARRVDAPTIDVRDVGDAAEADIDDAPDVMKPACPGGQVMCGVTCVDTSADVTHCGRCGNACPDPANGVATCEASACGITCDEGFHACGSSCVSDASAMTCGASCDPCPTRANAMSTCAAGACGFTCNDGFADCDTVADNGCEASLGAASTCGRCANQCAEPSPLCRASGGDSICVSGCDAATTRCAMSCVTLAIDPTNCGTCGNVCPTVANSTAVCGAGRCGSLCNLGFHPCGSLCADDHAPASCGASCSPCALPSNASATCEGGRCGFVCNAGFSDCDGAAGNGCEGELARSVMHCGTCGNACAGGQLCVDGACHCPTGQTLCGGVCTSTATDESNCGGCGHACPSVQLCVDSTCRCSTGLTLCGSACVNTASELANCGACGHACTGGQLCVESACACPAGQTFCGGACTSTATDLANCGACGHACVLGASCAAGACVCPAGQAVCGSACVDAQTDESNCGRCGGVCPAGVRCERGACTDGVTLTPDAASRFYVELADFTGGVRSWSAFRAASTAEHFDSTLTVVSYASTDDDGMRTWPVGRVGLRYTIPPSVTRVVSASLDLRAATGTWGDADPTNIVVVAFTPAALSAAADTDMDLSHWGMSTAFGQRPNADFGDGSSHAISITSTAGTAYLTAGGTLWLGVVTSHDQLDSAPDEAILSLTGMNLAASPTLRITYAP